MGDIKVQHRLVCLHTHHAARRLVIQRQHIANSGTTQAPRTTMSRWRALDTLAPHRAKELKDRFKS
jgi:hypothetical protein